VTNILGSRAQSVVRALALASLLGLIGCSGVSKGGSQQNSGGSGGSGSGPATLSAAPTSLSFAPLPVGNSSTLSVVITNVATGSDSANISQLTMSGSGFSLVSPPSLPLALADGQKVSLTVKFTASAGGQASGNLQVVSDASNSPLNVGLTGTGIAPGQLAVSPTALSFGNVTVGNEAQLGGTLTAGSTDITVTSADWSGTGYTLSDITFPVTIPAGTNVPFTVTFTPQAKGVAAGSVSFFSNATNSPTVQTWTGTGTQTSPHSVALSWNAIHSQVSGYNVYRGAVSGGPYSKLTSTLDPNTSYTDNGVQDGQTYYYVTTAVDSGGQESSYSNQAQAIIPQN
jgi:Abnormal spindle-like microcephaly-assoc'd, ASPM-SPD-2-Hydin